MEKNSDQNHQNKFFGVKKYRDIGITAFLVILSSLGIFFLIYQYKEFRALLGQFFKILQPIIYSLVIAYLLNPSVNYFNRKLNKILKKAIKNEKKRNRIVKILSIFFSLIIGLAIIITLGILIVPQVYQSILRLVNSLPDMVNNFQTWIYEIANQDSRVATYANQIVTEGTTYLENWLTDELLPQADTVVTLVTSGIFSVIKTLANILLGIIGSVYILGMKETLIGQSKKIIYGIFSRQNANIFLETMRKSHEIFGGFIVGKLIDSLIIGLLCFISMSVLKFPYVLLISVIIGVTNIIPVFGPYIGAIPSGLLILLVNPVQFLYFIIFILVLQQIDGNIIGPKILGNSTGLSPFWVLFAIVVFGGSWGFIGMVIGVPTFGVIYYIFNQFISYLLRKKKLPTDSYSYRKITALDENTFSTSKNLIIEHDEKDSKKEEDTNHEISNPKGK